MRFLSIQAPKRMLASGADARPLFLRMRWHALFGVALGYSAYYLVRNNFAFSSPYLTSILGWDKTHVGLLVSGMLIAYGISKAVMSSLADKSDVRRFMIVGLLFSVLCNFVLGFAHVYWLFAILLVLNGWAQGMGVGPSVVTIAHWFPRRMRGTASGLWNISHNVGGGLVAPVITGAVVLFGASEWEAACYWAPAAIVLLCCFVVWFVGRSIPESEGLPPLEEVFPEDVHHELIKTDRADRDKSTWQLVRRYILPNLNVWLVSVLDVCVYAVRFGVVTWIPLYLLQVKGLARNEMAFAFLIFEWAAIPSTLLAGIISDKVFKGHRMPLAFIAFSIIFATIFVYWSATDVGVISASLALIGCMVYIPQCMAYVQTMEIVPQVAVGAATGMRGLMSYLVGSSMGTALFGLLADHFGWTAGFYLLIVFTALGILACVLMHLSVLKMERANRLQAAAA